jgi:uncharacterized protein (UPF0147 family)
MGLWVVHKTELPHHVGEAADQPELQLWSNSTAPLVKTATDLITLDNVVVSKHRP